MDMFAGHPELFLSLLAGLAVVLIACYVYGIVRAQLRQRAMRDLAGQLQARFIARDFLLLSRLIGFDLFQQGRLSTRRINNVITLAGSRLTVRMFDFQWKERDSEGTTTVSQTVVLFEDASMKLPGFELHPAGWWDHVKIGIGIRPPVCADRPEFTSRFRLTGDVERFLDDLFDDEVVAYFLDRPMSSSAGRGSLLIFFRHRQLIPPDRLQEFWEDAFAGYLLLSKSAAKRLPSAIPALCKGVQRALSNGRKG